MGKAFQCDLCSDVQPGESAARVDVKPTEPGVTIPTGEWCDACLLSYSDWREARRIAATPAPRIISGSLEPRA